jgi:hypothetical protein
MQRHSTFPFALFLRKGKNMWDLNTLASLNQADRHCPDHYAHRHHPRIVALHHAINDLPIGPGYRARLRLSIYRYADQFVSRPEPPPKEGWSDLEALQQVTLSDALEASLRKKFTGA